MAPSLQTSVAALAAVGAGLSYIDSQLLLSHDIKLARKLGGYRRQIVENIKNDVLVVDFWNQSLNKHPDKVSTIMCEEDGSTRQFTFKEGDMYSNQVANLLASKNIKRGDTIALFMENRPEFIYTWLGASKLGVKIALINTSIVKKGLSHCINVSESKAIFFGIELEQPLSEVVPDLTGTILFCQGGKPALIPDAVHVDPLLLSQPKTTPPRAALNGIKHTDVWGYIYTSGTTGLPKAAKIQHMKCFTFGSGIATAFELRPEDVVYTCLPLFHSAGGGLGAGMMYVGGRTLVLRKKFSATRFFEDCTKHNVTAVQYIGELCRYLVASPPGKFDRSHKVRIAIGNGLRPEIWEEFQTRFNIPEIGEFYGSTEGNGALFNLCRSPQDRGAVGRLGWLLKRVTNTKLAKYDIEKECLVRGPDGLCIEAALGEPGELLTIIKDEDPATAFVGYTDKAATEKKIARDCFVKGDKYFSTGDLLIRDARGYYYFSDRLGDTFRWKGENCSTNEIASILSDFTDDSGAKPLEEVNVYGVLVPNNRDGRAPCAALSVKHGANFNAEKFLAFAKKNLPSYSVPLFLRMTPTIQVTATFKHQKVDYRNEGMDINKIKDPMFYLSPESNKYIPLTKDVYVKVTMPNARL